MTKARAILLNKKKQKNVPLVRFLSTTDICEAMDDFADIKTEEKDRAINFLTSLNKINDLKIKELSNLLSEQQSKHEQEIVELEALRDLNQWNFLVNKKPNAFEKGDWDGLRTEPILVQDKDGNTFIAIMYKGFLDGSEFCEFYETTYDFCIANVIKWRKI